MALITLKAVQYEYPEAVFDIFNYHHFLRYYPSENATKQILNKLICQKNILNLNNFLSIIDSKKLIKIDKEFIEILENAKNYSFASQIEFELFYTNMKLSNRLKFLD